ncbi:substrate-binding domain-containing protein [Amycolatopsis sp. CA-128772]|uniref:substrate-binding domain-containing protein n=1 Tax=Amycolatopsis sp. CA-128772 TaxID=2073159 RepID=UPI0018ECB929|nr:substrate-binding domain-containing protein [Amycolatopsis sp. CA-128772]
MTAEERRAKIVDLVRELGSIRVVALAERLGMAPVTVRRDVVALAAAGVLRRSHGTVSVPTRAVDGPRLVPDREWVVGMLIPAVVSYFDEIIDGARATAEALGARLALGIAPYGLGDDRFQVAQLTESGVDGLLVTPNWTSEGPSGEGAWICDLPVPTVLVERRAPAASACAGLDSVSSDHHHGVVLALRHFLALGHTSVMLAARRDTWTALQVRAGYCAAVRELGLTSSPLIDIEHPGRDAEAVADRIRGNVAEGVRAALVHNDQDAIQLMPLLRARGVRVPDDLDLISYDDVFAALSAPALTAVAPPKRAVGAAALDLLVRRLGRHDPALPVHHLELLPTLQIRASAGKAAAADVLG